MRVCLGRGGGELGGAAAEGAAEAVEMSFDPIGMASLSEGLAANRTLTSLALGGNQMGGTRHLLRLPRPSHPLAPFRCSSVCMSVLRLALRGHPALHF